MPSTDKNQLVTFGLITDTHVCDKPDQSATASAVFFSGGLAKIESFARAMKKAGVDFIAELGDFTDNPAAAASMSYEKRHDAAVAYIKAAEAKLSLYDGPRYHVFGNHDTDQVSKEEFAELAPSSGVDPVDGRYYYSWTVNGVHFIVLDASYKADGSAYSGVPDTPGAGYSWADSNVPDDELAWLEADLAANRLPTIVLAHQLLNPLAMIEIGFDTKHYVKQAAAIRAILEKSGQVLAVFMGHWHDGGLQVIKGINYVVLQANVAYGSDAAFHNQFATVEVRATDAKSFRINVVGNGMQENYTLNASIS